MRVVGTPPGPPPHFAGAVVDGALVLSWDAPSDDVAAYVVFADGQPWRTVDGGIHSVTIGSFGADDARRFSVEALDIVGNTGAESPALVGVPNLVGMPVTQAADAAAARGLLLGNQKLGFGVGAGVVMAQTPSPVSLVAQGTTVQVLLAPAVGPSTPLVQTVQPIRITCARGIRQLQLQVALSRRASVDWALHAVHRVMRGTFGSLPAGASRVRIALPRKLSPGRYQLVVTARSQGQQVRSTVRVALTSRVPETSACGR